MKEDARVTGPLFIVSLPECEPVRRLQPQKDKGGWNYNKFTKSGLYLTI